MSGDWTRLCGPRPEQRQRVLLPRLPQRLRRQPYHSASRRLHPTLANPLSAGSPAGRRSPTPRGPSAPRSDSPAAASTRSPKSCARRRRAARWCCESSPPTRQRVTEASTNRPRPQSPSVWTRSSTKPGSSSTWATVPSRSASSTSAMAWSMCGPRRATVTCAATASTGAWWTTPPTRSSRRTASTCVRPRTLQRLFGAAEQARTELNPVTRTPARGRAPSRQGRHRPVAAVAHRFVEETTAGRG